jgi:hypothetical protein
MRSSLLLTLVALACLTRLTASTEDAAARQARENLALVEQAYAQRQKPAADSWRSGIKSKESDLEHSLDWLIHNNQGEQALRFVDAMNFFWIEFGESQKSRLRFTQVLALKSASAATVLRAKVLYDAGVLAFRQGMPYRWAESKIACQSDSRVNNCRYIAISLTDPVVRAIASTPVIAAS